MIGDDHSVSEQPSFDAADPAVMDDLKGASRSAKDPDLELARLLEQLLGAREEELFEIAERLVRDAHSD